MRRRGKASSTTRGLGAPFLQRVVSLPEKIDPERYPFNVRAFSQGIDLTFRSKVTFLSARTAAANPRCSKRLRSAAVSIPRAAIATIIARRSPTARRWPRPSGCRGCRRSPKASSCARRASTTSRPTSTRSRICRAYGGKSLHEQSHGESFIALFANRFEQGLYILDEPEAALSPQRQLSFLKIIHDLATPGHAQFLIATHSPILLGYPGAVLFDLDGETIREISYRETKHFLITRDFLNSPERFFKHSVDVWR